MEGDMGPAPDTDKLCSAYIFNRMLSSKSTVRLRTYKTLKQNMYF